MGALNPANIKKTIYYLRRNGLIHTWYAVRERLAERKNAPYVYEPPSEETLKAQTEEALQAPNGCPDSPGFSIVVPLYRTKPRFLEELIDSVKRQSYPFWELILADATEDDSVRRALDGITETVPADRSRGEDAPSGVVRYLRLESNRGISENTNRALAYVQKEYVGLLDHDDMLTPDALYEMAAAIQKERRQGREPQIVYSDEDKCDESATSFFEPNRKEKFNYDLFLSNNYICHFMAMRRELIQKLGFRQGYDGAQDYDMLLRAVTELGIPDDPAGEAKICHVPKALYHWRCHGDSTAENPRSKEYAYEAGRRALQDFADRNAISARAAHLRHVGFYELQYTDDLFAARQDLGAVGEPLIERGRLCGGRMDETGRVYYEGLSSHFSGSLHRAALTQDAAAVDIRNMTVRRELHGLFREVTGVPYRCRKNKLQFDPDTLPAGTDYIALSLKLGQAIRERGYRILYRRGHE